jgi:hypothetical protein
MKRRRITALFGALFVLAAFGASYYVLLLKQQSATILSARETPESVQRYARIQEALKKTKTETPAPRTVAAIEIPEGEPESTELLEPLNEAKAVLDRAQTELLADKEGVALCEELLSRPVSTWSAEDWERLGAFLGGHRELLDQIRAMAADSGPLYPLDMSQGWAMELPHLAPLRTFARLLAADALSSAHAGDRAGAEADIRAGLQLAARLQGEPLLVSQLVGVAIDNLMMEGISGAYPEGSIPPALATEVALYFAANGISESIAQSMQTEAGISLDFFAQLMESGWGGDAEFMQIFDSGITGPGALPLGYWTGYLYTTPLARPWQDLDMQAYAQIMNEFTPTLALPYYEAQEAIEQLQREVDDLPATRVITHAMLPGLLSIQTAIAQAEAQRQVFLLGVAVESYANEHGAYPTNLNDVQGLANGVSTIDPFTGAPYHYSSSGNGFELYSVGRDLTDDGGRNDLRDGDIVWRGATTQKKATMKVAELK